MNRTKVTHSKRRRELKMRKGWVLDLLEAIKVGTGYASTQTRKHIQTSSFTKLSQHQAWRKPSAPYDVLRMNKLFIFWLKNMQSQVWNKHVDLKWMNTTKNHMNWTLKLIEMKIGWVHLKKSFCSDDRWKSDELSQKYLISMKIV